MITSIIQIGNSQGIRIPKLALLESGLPNEVQLIIKLNEIKIVPVKSKNQSFSTASEDSFKKDWLNKEEDKAWKIYQPAK